MGQQRGATLIEYALLVSMIVMIATSSIKLLGASTANVLATAAWSMNPR